jgi:hypothetical protein
MIYTQLTICALCTHMHVYICMCTYTFITPSGDDGIFWMQVSDFVRNFTDVTYVYMLQGLHRQVVRGNHHHILVYIYIKVFHL